MSDILEELRSEGERVVEVGRTKPHLEAVTAELRAKWEEVGLPGLQALRTLQKDKGDWLDQVCGLPWEQLLANSAGQPDQEHVNRARDRALAIRSDLYKQAEQLAGVPGRITCFEPAQDSLATLRADIAGPGVVADLRAQCETLEHLLAAVGRRRTKIGAAKLKLIPAPQAA